MPGGGSGRLHQAKNDEVGTKRLNKVILSPNLLFYKGCQ